ncbi:MAG: flagellar hook protein FlgE [Firmicutes bacterium]|nr:flagellar hook protein FlgE [Bacillota bacterium]
MMRSMFSAVSGLKTHQIRMDAIGNNIANVNTIGFKAGRVTFQEMFSQTMRGASAPDADKGGTNPQQVGLGVALGSIDTIHGQGNRQSTAKVTDLAIQGSGFFVVDDGGTKYYTRAGAFDLDSQGNLVDPGGRLVQGWMATNGVFGSKDTATLSSIAIPVGQAIQATPTTNVTWGHNLDASAVAGFTRTTSVDALDSLGRSHSITMEFQKTAVPNEWAWTATGPAGISGNTGTITFNPDGTFNAMTGGPVQFSPAGANPVSITWDFSRVTQNAGESSMEFIERDGSPMGTLGRITIDASGVITGTYSNGRTQAIAQVSIGNFANPGGLLRVGDNLYEESNNSGPVQIGEAGTGGRGDIFPSALEMSNVDLAEEFTSMIVTQRGFQANSRVITASDELLQDLVNLKR